LPRVVSRGRAPALGLLVAAALALAGLAPAGAAADRGDLVGGRFSDCFWNYGAFGVHDFNIAYPDAGATYWVAGFRRPPGSQLVLRGKYPHARYMSFQTYDLLGRGVDALADYQLDPRPGSTNPFRGGAERSVRRRSFELSVVHEPNPGFPLQAYNGEPARNRLYAVADSGPITEPDGSGVHELDLLMVRVYVPDRGRNLTGGVGLPKPTLTLADGTVLRGQALCDAVDSESKALGHTRVPDPGALLISEQDYEAMHYPNELSAPVDVFAGLTSVPRQVDPWFPAIREGEWRAQYDRRYLLQLWTGDDAPGASLTPPPRGASGGFFPNVHNAYVRVAIDRHFGEVAAFRGKLARTPRTLDGEGRLGGGQMRYASYCMNEAPVTTRVTDCVFDEQIPVNAKRIYTIVVSRAEDRPRTARRRCGIAWVRWSRRGDGHRDPDFGWFQIRNMLPSRGFEHAIQRTSTPGDERAVVGRYLPRLRYYEDAAAFADSRAGRCRAR